MMILTIIVADSIIKKPRSTDMSFHFVASLASALAGSTIKSPIHTIIPTARKKVTSCTLSTTIWISVIKSHQLSVTSSLGSDPDCITSVGLQLLKPFRGFLRSNWHHEALPKTDRVLIKNIQRMQKSFFILIDIEICQKWDNKPCKGDKGESEYDISEWLHSGGHLFHISWSP